MKVQQGVLVAVVLAMGLSVLPKVGIGGPPDTATIRFGRPEVGSPFPPPSGHDRSTHAKDSMVPRTVVISQGGIVTFEVAFFHQVAIYEPGTTPDDIFDDIDSGAATLDDLAVPFPPFILPGFVINDPHGRIFLGPGQLLPGPVTVQFDEPGRYLVICTTVPHFVDNDMFGWVIVK